MRGVVAAPGAIVASALGVFRAPQRSGEVRFIPDLMVGIVR